MTQPGVKYILRRSLHEDRVWFTSFRVNAQRFGVPLDTTVTADRSKATQFNGGKPLDLMIRRIRAHGYRSCTAEAA